MELLIRDRYGVDEVMERFTQRIVTGTLGEKIGWHGGRFEIIYQDCRRLSAARWMVRMWLATLLMMLGFLPGIIYLVWSQKKVRTTTIDLAWGEDGSVLVEITGNDPKALKALRRFAEKELMAVPRPGG
jgi:hypothetical protein